MNLDYIPCRWENYKYHQDLEETIGDLDGWIWLLNMELD